MRFDILTIFPDALQSVFSIGVLRQAQEAGLIEVHLHDLRNFTDDPHRVVDDRPYGGGAGMLMKVEPFVRGIEAIREETGPNTKAVLLSPQGRLFHQRDAICWGKLDGLILLCGRYEGVDERILDYVDDEISIGDYVLTGGEIPAAVVVEATARMTPGVVGQYDSVERDSFFDKKRIGAPQYTRPPVFRGRDVPEILLSGDHAKIEAFREAEAWKKTVRNRPDLLGLTVDPPNDRGRPSTRPGNVEGADEDG